MEKTCMEYLPSTGQWAKYKKLMYFTVVLFCVAIVALSLIKKLYAGDMAKWPQEGSEVWSAGDLVIDVSNISQGYFLARSAYEISQRLKLRVVVNGTTLDYDLPGTAKYIVVPLQMGSGYYEATLYENVSGKKYMEAGSMGFYAELEQENIAFLYPNQYVDYTRESGAVAESDSLSQGQSQRAIFDAVCNFMKSGFVYDFIKAVSIKPGMLPDIDGSFEKRMGVCQDLSAIMCCMLRIQGIPSRLVIGYADGEYHAWVVATVDGEDIFYDPTAELNAINFPKEYSVERFY